MNPDSSTIGQYRHADGMVQLMNQHAPLNIPMITVGDFNADSSSTVMQFLIHQTAITYNSTTITNPVELDDSWYVANPFVEKPGTVGSGGITAIDWILTTPNTNVLNAIIDDQGVNPNGGFPSDHRPLVITFNLPDITPIDEISSDFKLKVFPNPFQENIQFEIELEMADEISLKIFDTLGRLVKTKEVAEINAGNHQIEIDLNDLMDGIYFYQLQTTKEQSKGSIIKRNTF